MPLEVIGAGYPRTGTLSLKLALEQLGFGPCHHMAEFFTRPGLTELWAAGLGREPVDWDELLAGYRSCTDAPCCFFYQELAERNPQAKVILSLRSPESWWTSASATVMAATPAPRVLPIVESMAKAQRRRGAGGFDPRSSDKDAAIAAFNAHNAEVRRVIAPERLLVFEASQGWGPLCAFLGVAVPDTPYPRVNTSEEFRGNVERAGAGFDPH
jgi:hypothetical protein